MGHGNGDCFPVPRSGHPEDVPTDRQVLNAIHLDVHRILAALNGLSRAGQHQADGTLKLIKAIETELATRPEVAAMGGRDAAENERMDREHGWETEERDGKKYFRGASTDWCWYPAGIIPWLNNLEVTHGHGAAGH